MDKTFVINHIGYGEFDRAREEVRDRISASLFAWVKSDADFARQINDLPRIKKEVAIERIGNTADRFDLMCCQEVFTTASLKADAVVAHLRKRLNDIQDIDIMDVIIISSICNKIDEIIENENINEYHLVYILEDLQSIMDGSLKLSIMDCSVPI